MSQYVQLTNELRERQRGHLKYSPTTQMQLTVLSHYAGATVDDIIPALTHLMERENYGIPCLVLWPTDPSDPMSPVYEAVTLDRYQAIGLAAVVNISTFPQTVAYWDNAEDTKRQLQLQNIVLQIARPVQPNLPMNSQFKLVNNHLALSTTMIATMLGVHHHDVVFKTEQMFNIIGLNPDDYLSHEVSPDNYGKVYDLPKLEGFTVLSGYDVKLRYTITSRWLALENPAITQMAPYDLYMEMHRQFAMMQQEILRARIAGERQTMALQDLKQDNEMLARHIAVLKGEEVDALSFDAEEDEYEY